MRIRRQQDQALRWLSASPLQALSTLDPRSSRVGQDWAVAGEIVPPSGTVTFLLTDVEDSTRLWDQHPLQMREALEQHDTLLAAAIYANGGYVFTTAGDSFAAAFQAAEAAAHAALDIQTAIASVSWDPTTPIRVRIGLHTGEAHERGGDYFGPAVNRAARIEAAGHGQQALISGVTAKVLAGSTTTDWELTDLGHHGLKGLTQPEHIHQLGSGTFADPRTEDTRRTNLPSGRAALVGREIDVDEAVDRCESDRLVTLTGLGGIGKTSLAAEVAHRLVATETGALWWCDLISAKPNEVVRAISKAIGNEDASLDEEGLAAALRRHGPTRLVLDNCEHVIDLRLDHRWSAPVGQRGAYSRDLSRSDRLDKRNHSCGHSSRSRWRVSRAVQTRHASSRGDTN